MAWSRIAAHGWEFDHPPTWDVVVNRGHWREGYLLFADGRHGRVNLTWDRRERSPDFERTLGQLDRRLAKESQGKLHLTHSSDLDGRGRFARWVGPEGDFHAAVIRAHGAPVTFVIREVEPGDGNAVKRMALSCSAVGDGDPCRWALYGLDFDLPGWWRLEGLQNLVGLVRGVWMFNPGGGTRTAGVLTMRRYALADHLLAGRSLEEWLAGNINPRDRLGERFTAADGTATVMAEAPGTGWYRRLRGIREPRIYHAWREPELDRLMVQEWRGRSDPLPCLRRRFPAKTDASATGPGDPGSTP